MHIDSAEVPQLRVGGLVPLTTIDYPGELAAVVFCQGCAWRCRYCQNIDLLDPKADTPITWAEIIDFLERRRGLLDAVVFSGGEPTLQSALPDAMREVRALGFKVGLHTAGPYPRRLASLLPLLDWVALDIKALPQGYPEVTGVAGSGQGPWKSLRLIQGAGVPLEVRTTLMPNWTPKDLETLAAALARAGVRRYAIQACQIQHALEPDLPRPTLRIQELAAFITTLPFDDLIVRGH
jgi:pyruvate formate lyase activating enzyme